MTYYAYLRKATDTIAYGFEGDVFHVDCVSEKEFAAMREANPYAFWPIFASDEIDAICPKCHQAIDANGYRRLTY